MNRVIVFLAFACLSIRSVVAIGLPSLTGGEPRFWESSECLLARVEKTTALDNLRWRFSLRVLASLRGDGSLLKNAFIEVNTIIDVGSRLPRSAISAVPERNSCVVVVVCRNAESGELWIDPAYMLFMPDKCGIASVKGDPLEFVDKLRKAILEARPPKPLPFKQGK